jgi:hypothetical protein
VITSSVSGSCDDPRKKPDRFPRFLVNTRQFTGTGPLGHLSEDRSWIGHGYLPGDACRSASVDAGENAPSGLAVGEVGDHRRVVGGWRVAAGGGVGADARPGVRS